MGAQPARSWGGRPPPHAPPAAIDAARAQRLKIMSAPPDKLDRQRTYLKEPVVPAADFIRPTTTVEYAPLDPQTSIAETKLKDEIPRNNQPATGPVDFTAHSRDDSSSW